MNSARIRKLLKEAAGSKPLPDDLRARLEVALDTGTVRGKSGELEALPSEPRREASRQPRVQPRDRWRGLRVFTSLAAAILILAPASFYLASYVRTEPRITTPRARAPETPRSQKKTTKPKPKRTVTAQPSVPPEVANGFGVPVTPPSPVVVDDPPPPPTGEPLPLRGLAGGFCTSSEVTEGRTDMGQVVLSAPAQQPAPAETPTPDGTASPSSTSPEENDSGRGTVEVTVELNEEAPDQNYTVILMSFETPEATSSCNGASALGVFEKGQAPTTYTESLAVGTYYFRVILQPAEDYSNKNLIASPPVAMTLQ